jgi:5,10-methylenetetrahydromethanopterin reductase
VTSGKISFGLSRLATDPRDYGDWAQLADDCGFDLIGFGDSQGRWTDVYSMLAVTAMRTQKLRMGPFVTNPHTRHPQVSAAAISTIDLLSGGRAFFGIGTGETATRDTGAQRPRMRDVEEYGTTVRALLSEQEADYRGTSLRMLWNVPKVPLWIAGIGPRMLHLAGRVGDGVICGNGATPEIARYCLDQIAAGAAESGRSLADLEVWFMTRVHLASSEEAGFDELRFYLAAYADDRLYGKEAIFGQPIPKDIQDRLAAMHDEFDDANRLNPRATHNADLVDKYDLREWIGRQFVITVPPEHCAAGIEALAAAGETNLVMPQMLGDVMTTTRDLGDRLLPLFH